MNTDLAIVERTLENNELARRLARYGFCCKVNRMMTGAGESFIRKAYVEQEQLTRKATRWLAEKGGCKTNADRILRFLVKVHGNDLSTLKIDDPRTLLNLYEAFVVTNRRANVSINRFYYLAVDLVSQRHPILTCKRCEKPYLTIDVRNKECGVCHDIQARKDLMESVRRRRAEKIAS